jgi:hypothetical protein
VSIARLRNLAASHSLRVFVTARFLVAAWLLASVSGPVSAADLAWSAPSECGDASDVRKQVERLIDEPLSKVDDIAFDVRIEPARQHQWRLTLQTRTAGQARTRELFGISCSEVKDAAAVAIAMTISAHGQQRREPSAAASNADTSAPSKQTVSHHPVAPPTAASSPADRLRFAVAAALALDLGILPRLAPGPELEVSLHWSVLRVIALAALFSAQPARLADGVRGGDISMWLTGLLVCGERTLDRFALLGCGGFELGKVSVEAVGVARQHNTSKPTYGPRAELGALWEVADATRLWVRVGGVLPLLRDQYVLNDDPALPVYKASQLSLRATLGVELSF